MSALKVMVPVILKPEPVAVSPAQPVFNVIDDVSTLIHDDVIFHVPMTSPPHAAVLPQVPPEPPHPARTVTAHTLRNPTSRFFMAPASQKFCRVGSDPGHRAQRMIVVAHFTVGMSRSLVET